MGKLGKLVQSLGPIISGLAGTGTFISVLYLMITGATPSPAVRGVLYFASATCALLLVVGVLLWLFIGSRDRVGAAGGDLARLQGEVAHRDAEISAIKTRFSKSFEQLNQILAIDFRYCSYLESVRSNPDQKEVRARLDWYLNEVLAHTSKLFLDYTGHQCSSCIKALCTSATEQTQIKAADIRSPDLPRFVFTLKRDASSREGRDRVDQEGSPLYIYEHSKNSAFYHIMHHKEYGGYYTKDRLRERSIDEYSNINAEWPKHYDAVCVAALKNPQTNAVEKSIGFICVDNFGGGFDNEVCRQMLECIASIVYYSMWITEDLLDSSTGERHDG